MKKYIALFVVLVVLMLAACQPSQLGATQTPTTTTPSQTTKQTENAVLPTTVTPTEKEPTTGATQPRGTETTLSIDTFVPNSYGYPFVYDGTLPEAWGNVDVSDCVVGQLYYRDIVSNEIYFICSDPVLEKCSNDSHVFYVTEAEPTKIYAAPLTDFSQRDVVYETASGAIVTYLTDGPHQYENTVLQIVEGNQRFIWLDLTTSTPELVMEQYYIEKATIDSNDAYVVEDIWYVKNTNVVYFVGKLQENDELTEYLYYRDTGKIEVCPYL